MQNIARLAFASHAILMAAAATGGGGKASAPPPVAAETGKKAKPPAAEVLEIVSNIAKPASSKSDRSSYPFDKLEVGSSFGVKNRDKKSFNSILYMAHNRYAEPVLNADGTPKMRTKKLKGGGTELVAETKRTREFEAFDVDPKTDPQGASVRIFRNK
jgi:hypothetical protein